MKTWIQKRRIKKLRTKMLQAKEDQMHHRLVAQHYSDLIHDMEAELESLDAFHTDTTLIDFSQHLQHTPPERKIITAGQL